MSSPTSPYVPERERFVDDLLGYMTMEEKVGQLALLRDAPNTSDRNRARSSSGAMDQLRRGLVTGFMNVESPTDAERLQRIAIEETRLGIPLFFAADLGRGRDTVFPAPIAAAASWDAEAVELAAHIIGEETGHAGINWVLGPTVEFSAYLRQGGFAQSSGEDAWLAERMAIARIRGLQSASGGLLACLRMDDFAGKRNQRSGATPNDFDLVLATIEEGRPASVAIDTWHRNYIDVQTNLTQPFSMSGRTSGYPGMMLAQWAHFATLAGQQNLDPGFVGLSIEHVLAAIDDGRIDSDSVDEAVARVLSAKFDLGLFRSGLAPQDTTSVPGNALSGNARNYALDLARKSIVLLRNEPALLPLTTDSGELLVVGSAARDRSIALGGSKGKASSVLDGLDSFGIGYKFVPGLALREGSSSGRLIDADRMAIGMAGEAAKRSRTVVVVLGNDALSPDLTRLGEAHETLVEMLRSTNERLVLVTLGDRPVDPDVAGSALPCVLHAGQLGSMSGHAIAEVLTGEVSPTGRLPYTVPGPGGERRLPFGHGLSFTDIAIGDFVFELAVDRILAGCTLRNVGDRRGQETVQLYIRPLGGSHVPKKTQLRAFKKIVLDPGSRERLTFEIGARELGRYREDGIFVVEPGQYEISVGSSAGRLHTSQIVIPASLAEAISNPARSPSQRNSITDNRRQA